MSPSVRQPDFLFRDASSPYPPRHKSAAVMVAFFIAILGVGYILFHSSTIVATPGLLIIQPSDGAVVHNERVSISGQTDPKSRVEINGYEIYSEDDGSFALELPLRKGFHILDFRVKNRIGKEARVVRHIVVE